MGYPVFNLNTIQLPIPSSTMTKSEYKQAYGIDLDSIDFQNVTLLWKGKRKYFVDSIKENESEIDIYAGGIKFSISSGNVEIDEESYDVTSPSGLTLYKHTITGTFRTPGESIYSLNVSIIDANSTPYVSSEVIQALFNSLEIQGEILNAGDDLYVTIFATTSNKLVTYNNEESFVTIGESFFESDLHFTDVVSIYN